MQTQTLNISLPKSLVKKVDKVAKKEYRNRSELIRAALRRYVTDVEGWKHIYKAGRKAAKLTGVKSEEDVVKTVREYRRGK